MFYKIENDFLTAEINDLGAELHSLISKQSGIEYIWQGNPAIWNGQSPLLFPIIGQLLDGKFIYNGNEYSLSKHGFARNSIFKIADSSSTGIFFSLQSNSSTLKMYPFDFELQVCFDLIGNDIQVTHKVINKDNGDMYFSIGAHPGFNCEIGDILEFSENETLKTERIDENAIIINEKFPLLENTSQIEITNEIFVNDALFLSGIKSSHITLKSPRHNREVRFNLGTAPFLGIWAKPGAPYVCIEPWYGINDDYQKKTDISKKRGIQKLKAKESFEFSWSAQIFEPEN
jgi:galactose mutarotase-like enzyme